MTLEEKDNDEKEEEEEERRSGTIDRITGDRPLTLYLEALPSRP